MAKARARGRMTRLRLRGALYFALGALVSARERLLCVCARRALPLVPAGVEGVHAGVVAALGPGGVFGAPEGIGEGGCEAVVVDVFPAAGAE
jgi:hypothetical protein